MWNMTDIRIESVSDPFSDPAPARLAARVLAFAATAGLLGERPIRALDADVWKMVLAGLRKAGLAGTIPLTAAGSSRPATFARELERLYEAIEDSPLPRFEWEPMRRLFGDESLAALLGVTRPSLQRYASGERDTPQEVAERLHVLSLIASDLAGSYNDFGIRRWFVRPRDALGRRSPSQVLRPGWGPDDPMVARVRSLAAALVSSAAT